MVEVIHRYSNHRYTLTSLKKLQNKLQKTTKQPSRDNVPGRIHALRGRLTNVQVETIIAEYQQGATPAELARAHRISKSALVALLHEHGLALRNHGLTKTQAEEARWLRQQGETYAAIAQKFGVHKSTVWHAVNPGHGPPSNKVI